MINNTSHANEIQNNNSDYTINKNNKYKHENKLRDSFMEEHSNDIGIMKTERGSPSDLQFHVNFINMISRHITFFLYTVLTCYMYNIVFIFNDIRLILAYPCCFWSSELDLWAPLHNRQKFCIYFVQKKTTFFKYKLMNQTWLIY